MVTKREPLQERWLMENWLRRNDAALSNVALTYVSGERQRAPRWMTSPDGESRPAPTAWSGWAGSSSHPAALS